MNCKPGDLATIVRGINGPSIHIGKIVTVLGHHSTHPKLGQIWNIEFSRAVQVGAYKRNLTALDGDALVDRCQCADDWLRPLPGEAAPNEHEILVVQELEAA